MSIHLIRDLDSLHRDLLSMSAKVEQMVYKAVDGLADPHSAFAHDLAVQDEEIDRLDVRIEEECLKMLALHQPVAADLRRIAAVLKIAGELERVADLGVHIAERTCELIPGTEIVVLDKLKDMSQIALNMLHRALDAYVALDTRAARRICCDDDLVDDMNREIIQQLLETMQAKPELIESSMQLFSVSRHVERVADHATNIAEDVVYLVEGEIIRHGAFV